MSTIRAMLAAVFLAVLGAQAADVFPFPVESRGRIGNGTYVATVARDTLKASGDTIVLFRGLTEPSGKEVIVTWDSIVGTGADSVAFHIRVDCYGNAGTIVGRWTDTSVTWCNPYQRILRLGEFAVGKTYTAYMVGEAAIGTQVIFPHIERYTRESKY